MKAFIRHAWLQKSITRNNARKRRHEKRQNIRAMRRAGKPTLVGYWAEVEQIRADDLAHFHKEQMREQEREHWAWEQEWERENEARRLAWEARCVGWEAV